MTWILSLNHMRERTEERRNVACADTRAALEAFVAAERAPAPYTELEEARHVVGRDGDYVTPWKWHKVFRKGGPLEWFNPPDAQSFVELISEEAAAQQLITERRRWLSTIQFVTEVYTPCAPHSS